MSRLKFKLDENLPRDAVALLRAAGHDAVSVLDQSMGGRTDGALADVCREESRTLVTLDLDFSNIRVFPPSEYSGIVVLRVPSQEVGTIVATLQEFLDPAGSEDLAGALWIVEPGRVRVQRGES